MSYVFQNSNHIDDDDEDDLINEAVWFSLRRKLQVLAQKALNKHLEW